MSISLYCDGIKVSRRSVWVSNAFEFSVAWTNKIKNVLNVVASSATQAKQESRYIVISQTVKTQAIADDWAIIES